MKIFINCCLELEEFHYGTSAAIRNMYFKSLLNTQRLIIFDCGITYEMLSCIWMTALNDCSGHAVVANIPAHLYTGHGVCIKTATTAALASIEDHTVQTLGHWKSLAYRLYIRLNPSHLVKMFTTMAQCPSYLSWTCRVN